MKSRLYDKNMRAKGTIEIDENQSIRLRFSRTSPLMMKFRENINKFLKENKLKIVSNQGSLRKHHNYKNYNKKINGLDIFIKRINPRTQKIELKPITK